MEAYLQQGCSLRAACRLTIVGVHLLRVPDTHSIRVRGSQCVALWFDRGWLGLRLGLSFLLGQIKVKVF